MNVRDMRNEKRSIRWDHLLPITVCLIYLVVAVYAGRNYVVGSYDDSDFYMYYAPDAKHITNGVLPENTIFNGPGYPLVLSAITALTGDHFISGKWIGAFSASLSGLAAYYLFRALFGFRTAILALPIMLVSGDYAPFSIKPLTALANTSFASLTEVAEALGTSVLNATQVGSLLGGFGGSLSTNQAVTLGTLLGGFGTSTSSPSQLGSLLGGFGNTAGSSLTALGELLGGFGASLTGSQLGSLLG